MEKQESTDISVPNVVRIQPSPATQQQQPPQQQQQQPHLQAQPIRPKLKEHRLLLYLFSFVTVSLSSGLVYGYPHFRTNLLLNGSSLTESELGIIFTVGSWTVQGGWFFSGMARDQFGTRTVAFVCLLFSTIGSTGLAYSSPNHVMWLSTSFFFVGLGSGGMLCFQPVASLFSERWQGTVMASLSGAFQISGLVFLMLSRLTLNRRRSFTFFSIVLLGLALTSLWLLPKGEFRTYVAAVDDDNEVLSSVVEMEEHEDEHFNSSANDIPNMKNNNSVHSAEKLKRNCGDETSDTFEDIHTQTNDELHKQESFLDDNIPTKHIQSIRSTQSTQSTQDTTLTDIIKSKEYILLVLWFSTMLIPMQYYIGTIAFQLERKGDNSGTYINLFSISYASAAIVSPIMGKIADVGGPETSQFIATLLVATSLFILSLNQLSLQTQLTGIICYAIGRVGTFGMFFTSIGKRFGYVHYGRLAGLGLLISATSSILQYPLIYIAAEWYYEIHVNVISGFVILFVGVPYCAWTKIQYWKEHKLELVEIKKEQVNAALQAISTVHEQPIYKDEVSC